MNINMNEKFLWIASQKFISEALASSLSVRKFYPDAELTLLTDCESCISSPNFDRVITIDEYGSRLWYLRSVFYMRHVISKYYQDGDKVIYMDTDTHMIDDVDDIFAMLEAFDFVGAIAPGRQTAKTVEPIPLSFPEYNIGVQGIKVCVDIRRFLAQWFYQYKEHQSIYENNDQAPLRETIWKYYSNELSWDCSLKIGTMPIEFNYRFGMGGQVRGPIKVLHGRSYDYEKLADIVNEKPWSIRAWKPGELK